MRKILVLVFLLLSSHAKAAETWTLQNVVLVASQGWEFISGAPKGAVAEPKVLGPSQQCFIVAPPCLRMWYTGAIGALGYAETADLSGQSGFVKYASNPLVGQGRVTPTAAAHSTLVVDGSNICLIYSTTITAMNASFEITCSGDGVTNWSAPIIIMSPGAQDVSLANPFVWKEGGRWQMFYESFTPAGSWQLFRATSASLTSTWSKLNSGQPVTTMQVTGGGYSGPNMHVINGFKNFWTHQSPTNGVVIPTSIYHDCEPLGASGLQNANGGLPIASPRAGFDQVGDPWLLDLNGTATMFADEDNNTNPYSQISVWTATGPLSSLSCP